MNILTRYAHPVSHSSLRALLAIIDSAVARGDSITLEYAYDLIPPFDGDVRTSCAIYIRGLIESIEHSDREYAIYSEEDITAARLSLDQVAFGDFDEAMYALDRDLMALDPHVAVDASSDAFRPEFFDSDNQTIWHELRQVIINYKADPARDFTLEAFVAHQRLREYQQKSYGPLLPTMVATYLCHIHGIAEGMSARFAWVDDTLNIEAAEPLAGLLNEYFAGDDQVVAAEQFNEEMLPRIVGEFHLMNAASSTMYRYEL